jgi:hypothetical protein
MEAIAADRHARLRPSALRAGNRTSLAALSFSRRVVADSQHHPSHGKKRRWQCGTTRTRGRNSSRKPRFVRFPAFALSGACAGGRRRAYRSATFHAGHHSKGTTCRLIGGSWQSRPTMSVAIGEAPKRRRRFPEQILAHSVGSMLAHEALVFERLRAFCRGANRRPGVTRGADAVGVDERRCLNQCASGAMMAR